jgi:plasmid stability protein
MAKTKTTLSLDEDLMRQVRVRAARTGTSQSETLERALREGLGILDRLRAKASLDEEEAVGVATEVVHEVRAGRDPDRTS